MRFNAKEAHELTHSKPTEERLFFGEGFYRAIRNSASKGFHSCIILVRKNNDEHTLKHIVPLLVKDGYSVARVDDGSFDANKVKYRVSW